ncbi:MAG TPA: TIM44-like domain-containing protein [Paucimonas sp.]|nr:TIM44-like domain-containing protein [Paucimonas sp.]
MKRFLVVLMLTISALSITISDAEARRLGGGGSFGRQSQSFSRRAPTAPSNQNYSQQRQASPSTTPQNMPQQRPASPWRGILGGALLGLGLGALLSHFGLGGAAAGLIGALLTVGLLVLAVSLLIRLLRGKSGGHGQPAYAGGYSSPRTPEIGSGLGLQQQPAALQGEPVAGNLPPGFDTQSFLRHAKTYFIRLQAAWDRADINDIREFTTPEVFGELRLQLQERGASPNVTDVVSLEAELLGIETGPNDYLASVRFSGTMKESENAPAEPFAEIWNLSKPLSGQGGWVLAGIQQLS